MLFGRILGFVFTLAFVVVGVVLFRAHADIQSISEESTPLKYSADSCQETGTCQEPERIPLQAPSGHDLSVSNAEGEIIDDCFSTGGCTEVTAVKSRDVTACDTVNGAFRQESCKTTVHKLNAVEDGNAGRCHDLPKEQVATCLSEVAFKRAVSKQDPDLCGEIVIESLRERCLTVFGR